MGGNFTEQNEFGVMPAGDELRNKVNCGMGPVRRVPVGGITEQNELVLCVTGSIAC
jgi:hypothetical protein